MHWVSSLYFVSLLLKNICCLFVNCVSIFNSCFKLSKDCCSNNLAVNISNPENTVQKIKPSIKAE